MNTPTQNALTGRQGSAGHLPGARLRRVIEHVQQNPDKDLTLSALAAVIHMSRFHFARLFKHSTGLPPHQFVVRQRIDHAMKLLTTAELSMAEIAPLVGFRTASHFSTIFRRVTGITPTRFRAGRSPDSRLASASVGGQDAPE